MRVYLTSRLEAVLSDTLTGDNICMEQQPNNNIKNIYQTEATYHGEIFTQAWKNRKSYRMLPTAKMFKFLPYVLLGISLNRFYPWYLPGLSFNPLSLREHGIS